MKKSITKLLCAILLFSFITSEVLAGAAITQRNKCKWWWKHVALANVSRYGVILQSRMDVGCSWAKSEAYRQNCASAYAYCSSSNHTVYAINYDWSCGAGESFILPQGETPADATGISEASMTSKAMVMGGNNLVNIQGIDGFIKGTINTRFGAVYRIIIWAPQDNVTTGMDENITADKILWEAAVRIENGQMIVSGGFSTNDFSVIYSDEAVTVSASNEQKIVRMAKASPSERLKREGIRLDFERDIRRPLMIANPRKVPVQVINNVTSENIAVTMMADVGFGTYVNVYAPGASSARIANSGVINAPGNSLNEIVFNNYPQPFSEKTNIEFKVPETQMLTMEVYNMDGKLIQVLFNGVANKEDEYRIEFNVANLPNGLYICKLRGEFATSRRKLLVIR